MKIIDNPTREHAQALLDNVREAARANPDFVYQKKVAVPSVSVKGMFIPGCVYVSGGQPSCIVGKAAWDAGLIDAAFEGAPENREGVVSLLENLGLYDQFTQKEREWLENVQGNQDNGNSWSTSVAFADESEDDL